MKKKKTLYILFIFLFVLIIIPLLLYIKYSPKQIRGEYVGTHYKYLDIQFNTYSNDFTEIGIPSSNRLYPRAYLEDSENNSISITKYEDDDYEIRTTNYNLSKYSNPLTVIKYCNPFKKVDDPGMNIGPGITFSTIKTYYGTNKRVLYYYTLYEDGTKTIIVKVHFSDVLYRFIINSDNAKKEANEIIKSINRTN